MPQLPVTEHHYPEFDTHPDQITAYQLEFWWAAEDFKELSLEIGKVATGNGGANQHQLKFYYNRLGGELLHLSDTIGNNIDFLRTAQNICGGDLEKSTKIELDSQPETSELQVKLTRKEQDVLELIAQGLSNSEISQTFRVTEQTTKFHLSNIYRKLDVESREEAARLFPSFGEAQQFVDKAAKAESLTPREEQVAELFLNQFSKAEIATTLFLSSGAIKSHLANIYRKLDVRNRIEAEQVLLNLEPFQALKRDFERVQKPAVPKKRAKTKTINEELKNMRALPTWEPNLSAKTREILYRLGNVGIIPPEEDTEEKLNTILPSRQILKVLLKEDFITTEEFKQGKLELTGLVIAFLLKLDSTRPILLSEDSRRKATELINRQIVAYRERRLTKGGLIT